MRTAADTAPQAPLDHPASMRRRLQEATQVQHRNVERHFALGDCGSTMTGYRRLLETLWGFQAPLETQLMQVDWQGSGIVMAARCKAAWLRADLLYLGLDAASIAQLAQCDTLPPLKDMAAGLGALYVLEGSTLGGQVILKILRTRLAIDPEAGARFFASYGRQIGVMWRDYLAVLEYAARALPVADAIEQSALDTFMAFDGWFEKCARRAEMAARADV